MPDRSLPWWFFPMSRAVTAATLRGAVRAAGAIGGLPATTIAATQRVLRFIDPKPRGSYEFLSEEWIAAAREIREEYAGREHILPPPMRVNYVVTEVPGRDVVHAHTDSTSGTISFELEHVDAPDATVTLPYDAARSLIVDSEATKAMQMLTTGAIKVEGDLTKLLALAAVPIDPLALEVAERIRAMTS